MGRVVRAMVGRSNLTLMPREPASPEEARDSDVSGGEVVLNGRRYRLVPVDVADPEPTPAPSRGPGVAELLTARELQIATLVAEGLINKQIADRLAISEWTVSTHLRRVFAKLGVETRAAMVCRCMGGARAP